MSRSAASGGRTGRRELEALRAELSDRDLSIVHSVSDLQFLTTRHIERLHFPLDQHTPLGAARSARRVLERLTRQRVLVRLARRVGGVRAGSAGHVYALGPVGARLVRRDQPRPRYREPSTTFLTHRLAIAELVVQMQDAARAELFEVLALQTEPSCWRRYRSITGERAVLKPDLRLTLGVGDYESHWFCEVDLGSEHLPALMRKCQQYQAAFRSGEEQRAIGLFPRVLWLVSDDQRVEDLTLAIVKDRELNGALFVVRERGRAIETLAAMPEGAS